MLIDGEEREWMPARDRGLLYGDGLFETIAVADGAPCLWERHMARLAAGCRRLAIPLPDARTLASEAEREIGDAPWGVLKILVTRGQGGRGYAPPEDPRPTRLVELAPAPGYPESWAQSGVRARRCATRLCANPATAGLKHLSRLEQVLARAEWADAGIAEGLMLDRDDRVVEGTKSNLFLVERGGLVTPDLSACGVAGVLRGLVIDLAREHGVPVAVRDVQWPELERAQALFLTNSLVGIWPIRELEGRALDVDAIPGELLRTVRERAFGG